MKLVDMIHQLNVLIDNGVKNKLIVKNLLKLIDFIIYEVIFLKNKRRRSLDVFSYSAIRALLRRRSQIETKYIKNDIIRDYTKFESTAYGPITRNGYFPDKLTDRYLVKSRYLDTYSGLLELESTLPSNALKIRLPAPKRITSTKDGHLKRHFRRERDLNNIFKVRFLYFIGEFEMS
jgi:hypothetical protein